MTEKRDVRDSFAPVAANYVTSSFHAEWRHQLEAAGLIVDEAALRELDWEFEPWITRIGFPASRVPELAAIVESASGPAREQLRPERRQGRLWHRYWHVLIRAHRP